MDDFEGFLILVFVGIIMIFTIITTITLIDINEMLNQRDGCISYNGEKYCKEVK